MDDLNDNPDALRKPSLSRDIPQVPWAWHYACELRDVLRGPVARSIGDREFVLFAADSNRVVAMDRRCVHMNADLAAGCVAQGRIRCPYHEWEFDQQGRCARIPAADTIPQFARQQVYPTAILGPHVVMFNSRDAEFEAPFFDGVTPGDLLAARPFGFEAEIPWYMVSANGFDLQHFRVAHDRTLVGEPQVSQPSPFAYRMQARFDVTGNSMRDRMTRRLCGPQMTMTVTSWCGTLVMATAQFARSTSYGLLSIRPLDANRSLLRNIVWVARRGGIMRALDPLDAMIRSWFIRAFLESDRERLQGVRYNPGSLIAADATLAGYMQWLKETVRGESFNRKRI